MTYQELRDKIITTSHRKDLVNVTPSFIEDARVTINYRLGLALAPLSNPDDTNEILTANPLLYFYPAMKGLYEYIVELENAAYYDTLWQAQAAQHFVTAPGTTPLTITPEVPAP
jgi:hypothetical protein